MKIDYSFDGIIIFFTLLTSIVLSWLKCGISKKLTSDSFSNIINEIIAFELFNIAKRITQEKYRETLLNIE